MTAPDTVFAYFVEANPVPEQLVVDPAADVEKLLRGDHGLSTHAGRPSVRRGLLVAGAAFAAVILLAFAWIALPLRSPSPEPANPEEALRRQAVAAVNELVAARNAGDIDRVFELSAPSASGSAVSMRRLEEFQAGFAEAGLPTTIVDCDATVVSASLVTGECRLEMADPVAAELGAAEQVAPYRYEDGLLTILEYRGDSVFAVNRAYSVYLRTFHPEDYSAACQPGAYEPGSIVQSELLALTGECADVAAPRAADVAAWLRAGRPAE